MHVLASPWLRFAVPEQRVLWVARCPEPCTPALQGGWSLAEEETSSRVLHAVRSAALPLHDHIYAHAAAAPEATAAAAHCRVVARSALENVMHLEAGQLASVAGMFPPCPPRATHIMC